MTTQAPERLQTPIDRVIARLEETGREYRQNNAGWFETSCPVQHNHKGGDGNPHSLHFREMTLDTDQDDTTVIFNCLSGSCTKAEIIKALQIKDNDLYSKPDSMTGLAAFRYSKSFENALTVHQYAHNKLLPDDYLMYELNVIEGVYTFHKRDGTPFKIKAMATPYYRRDGTQHECLKLRTAMKKEGRFSVHLWTEGDEKHITYGEHKIHEMVEAGFGIISEGESCTQTFWFHGYPALGIPGATNVESHLDPSLVMDVPKLYVIQEKTDQAGQNFPFRVKKHLESAGYKGEILRVPLMTLTEVKDASDLHIKLWDKTKPRDHERFREEIQKCLDQAKPMNYDTSRERVEIVVNNTQLRDTTQQAMDALRDSNAATERLYVHFSQLSRVVKNEDGRPIVQQMNVASVKGELTKSADFYRVRQTSDGEEIRVAVSPSNEISEQILALPPGEWKVPSLKGVTEVPLVKPDGTLLDTPGYDKKLKVFYDPSDDLKDLQIPEYCTQEDAINAAKVLLHLIAEFPFESDADKANMIGLILTPFIRHAFKGDIQLALLDATNPGTGKTFLAQIAAIIATGARTEARSQKGDDDEWRKFILAVLLKCPQIVLIDNVRGTLASVSLEAALTSETISDRLLGVSKDVSATNTAMWIATGNNLLIGGDLARRCFRIRLIANNANPDERDDYAIPEILDYCEEHRRELVTAILVMVKAWFQAEKPPAKVKIAKADSFGNWIKMVGGILNFAGIQGWQQNREELRSKNNEEAREWERFFNAWTRVYGCEWKRTIDIQKDVINGSPHSSVVADTQMFDALPAVLAEKFAKNRDSFYLSLAKALSFRKQTVYGLQGFQVESQEDSHTKNLVWRVTSKNGPENEPPQTPPEPKTQNGSTSGFSNTDKTDAVVCGGLDPLGYRKIFEKSETEVHSNTNSTHSNVFTEAQGVQTTANHRSPQNGHMPKVPLDGMASGLMALSEQSQESPVCGGSFSSTDSDGLNSSLSHHSLTIGIPVPDVQHQTTSVGDFMALGKRLGYPAVTDLDLKAGMMGWNGFSLSRRSRMVDVMNRFTHS